MKTPEEVAREFYCADEEAKINPEMRWATDVTVERLAALLRARDAEHEALRREERGRAFDAGVKAAGDWSAAFIVGQLERRDEADEAFAAARRAPWGVADLLAA